MTMLENLKARNILFGELDDIFNKITVKIHVFKGLDTDERKIKHESIIDMWKQFTSVCNGGVARSHINRYENWILSKGKDDKWLPFDYILSISIGSLILGFSIMSEKNLNIVNPMVNIIIDEKNRDCFGNDIILANVSNIQKDKSMYIDIICGHKSTKIGRQLLSACENFALRLGIVNIHLESVSPAFGFYKKMGFVDFRNPEDACSSIFDAGHGQLERSFLNIRNYFITTYSNSNRVTNVEKEFNKFSSRLSYKRGALLDAILSSGSLNNEQIAEFATKDKTTLVNMMDEIIMRIFSDRDHIEIPMSKCLLGKFNNIYS